MHLHRPRSAATIKFSSWQESPLLAELKWGFHCSRESRFSVSSFPLFKYLADPEFPDAMREEHFNRRFAPHK